jgi:IS30 family transposase
MVFGASMVVANERAKLVVNAQLRLRVEEDLRRRYSPEQICRARLIGMRA